MDDSLFKTTFEVPKMDCPSEERLIRMALEGDATVRELRFDFAVRSLVVVHAGPSAPILARLEPLRLGARTVTTSAEELGPLPGVTNEDSETSVLKHVLGINAAMFAFELAVGMRAQSTGLVADAADMFADAAVYALALYGVGRGLAHKQRAARFSAILQMGIAIVALAEVVRRAVSGSEPTGAIMMGVSLVALGANVLCLALLSRHRTGGVHMKASWIFSTSDVIANLGVIVAGGLVILTGSALPDLIIGALIAAVVLVGAGRIWGLSRR